MRYAAFAGQAHLALALGKALLLGVGGARKAVWTAHAFSEKGRCALKLTHWVPAGAAQPVRAWLQAMANRHALVKDKAFARPQAVLGGHGFKVFEDAALQMVNLVKPVHAQKRGGFFTADAAGAKHGDFGAAFRDLGNVAGFGGWVRAQQPARLLLPRHPGGQIGKGLDARVYRAGKRANAHLVVVAGVHHQHVGVTDQGIPVLRLDVLPCHLRGADAGHAEGDDFFLQAHFHAQKRWFA